MPELSKVYPKAKYNATLPPVLVNGEAEELQLGSEWFDHPDLAKKAPIVFRLPSAADLDAVEQDAEVAAATGPKRGRPAKTVAIDA